MNSPPDAWATAVDIFYDRINGRYLEPISILLKEKTKYSFIAMSLMCLLIDVFMQFRNGYPQSSVENGSKYTNFMRKDLGFDNLIAKRFYNDIRCGLLHSAETKNGSYLQFDKLDNSNPTLQNSAMAMSFEKGRYVLKVSVQGMYDRLEDYFDEYYCRLLEPKNELDIELRSNFIAKMDFITLSDDDFNKDSELWSAISKNVGKTLIASGGRSFKYEKDYDQVAIVVKRFVRSDDNNLDEITIPFSDIKNFALCGDFNNANQRRGAVRQIRYSVYIQSILECCPDEVEKYVKNARNRTGYSFR